MDKETLDNMSDEIKSYVKVETEPQKSKHQYDTKKQSNKKHKDNKKNHDTKNHDTTNHDNKNHDIKNHDTTYHGDTEKGIKKENKKENKKEELKKEDKKENKKEELKKEELKKVEVKKEEIKKDKPKKEEAKKVEELAKEVKKEEIKKEIKKSEAVEDKIQKEEVKKKKIKKELDNISPDKVTPISIEHVKEIAVSALKIIVPVAACAIVIAAIISYAGTRKNSGVATSGIEESENGSTLVLTDEPLEENAHEDVNELMAEFYQALATGDTDTIKALRDYNDDTEILQYEKKSEFIDSYDNVVCYTKSGLDENSYFVYVSYEVKVKDIETKAPGLNAFFVYRNDEGKLVIDGDMADDVTAAFKLVTNQDDVVDLYNRVDVSYNEAIASDEQLDSFMAELPMQIKTSVGEALAQLEAANGESQTATEENTEEAGTTTADSEVTKNQTVDQQVKTTDTVNVRSSDSQTADKIGKAAVGTELKRTEIKANGWSKVIFEGKEAYIKTEYLEVLSSNEVTVADTTNDSTTTTNTTTVEASGKVLALTNVNVRESANQNSTKLGTAVAGNKYDLLGVEGDWYKISFGASTGYVLGEYFQKQ
jgi:uncharacterized protein YgiM (DUF1202 family)